MLRNLERISRENYEIFVFMKMPKSLDMTRIFEGTKGTSARGFSRPPRYDHFDIPPYMNCRLADIIGYSIFLEMLFSVAFGVPEKPVFTRLFCVFASAMLANFQDRLVMTASITLRVDYLIVFFLAFRILDRDHFVRVFYRLENGVF